MAAKSPTMNVRRRFVWRGRQMVHVCVFFVFGGLGGRGGVWVCQCVGVRV